MTENSRFVPVGEDADLAAVIVTYNSAGDIPRLLADLRDNATSLRIRVIVVDNESQDDTAEVVAEQSDVNLIRSGGNLGFAGGINRARPHFAPCGAVLILNPDLRLRDGSIHAMRNALARRGVGAVVPLSYFDEDDTLDQTLRREPSILGAFGDAVLGGRRLPKRPPWLTETELAESNYTTPHAVDWATGAAMMIRSDVEYATGAWTEVFFLYSEETDYCRRIRHNGYLVWFEPSAVVQHSGAGSGTSPALLSLMTVNRVRYVARHRPRLYAAVYRGVIILAEAIRSNDPTHRNNLRLLLRRRRWRDLPHATPAPIAD